MEERLQKQLDFSLEIDKEKNILRQTHLSGNGRRENDAEHAWHMAVMAYILKEYSNREIDIAKVNDNDALYTMWMKLTPATPMPMTRRI